MKPALEFFSADTAPWLPLGDGLSERILSRDDATAVSTRMLRFDAGTSTPETLTHDFWEEVWIVGGAITDRRLGETFTAGMYACRPPGMPHGPWDSPEGCVTFEVRYPSTEVGA
jgi:ChrR Cupin-like domain